MFHQFINQDSPSDTSLSAPSLHSNSESQTTTTLTRNVTPETTSKRQRSQITDTSSVSPTSVSHSSRPPISEIPITTCSEPQPSPTHTPLIHIANSKSVERFVNYKQSTAIKTVRRQPQLNLVHIPDSEFTPIPPLQLPTDSNRTTSETYPPRKPLRKSCTSPSNFLQDASEYTSSHKSTRSPFIPHRNLTFETFLHEN